MALQLQMWTLGRLYVILGCRFSKQCGAPVVGQTCAQDSSLAIEPCWGGRVFVGVRPLREAPGALHVPGAVRPLTVSEEGVWRAMLGRTLGRDGPWCEAGGPGSAADTTVPVPLPSPASLRLGLRVLGQTPFLASKAAAALHNVSLLGCCCQAQGPALVSGGHCLSPVRRQAHAGP